tara:strand:- start:1453 stop:1689 length:237 start_codon:yes stop_codon:yes gene_type:complete
MRSLLILLLNILWIITIISSLSFLDYNRPTVENFYGLNEDYRNIMFFTLLISIILKVLIQKFSSVDVFRDTPIGRFFR